MSDIDFKKLSKEELEKVGRQHGIELDRRLIKSKMVKQLIEHINKSDCGCGNTQDLQGKCDGSHNAKQKPAVRGFRTKSSDANI